MIATMTAVVTVSFRVGHTTFAVSARTCRRNSPGLTFAKRQTPYPNTNKANGRPLSDGRCLDLPKAPGPAGRFVLGRLILGQVAAAKMAGVEGLEPPALGFGDRCSTS